MNMLSILLSILQSECEIMSIKNNCGSLIEKENDGRNVKSRRIINKISLDNMFILLWQLVLSI